MSNKKRKIIYFLVTVLFIALFIFVGININKKDKANDSADYLVEKQTLKQCKEQINKMNVDELTQYVFNLCNISLKNRAERFRAIRNMEFFSRYLSCKFERSNDVKEKENIFNNAALIIEQGSRNKGRELEVNPVSKENFNNPDGSFIRTIALKDFNDFCPSELPQMCARENGIFFEETSEWCENICATLEHYKNDKYLFNREIMDFSSDGILIKDKMLVYVWRMDFAFGLGGEEKALEVCDAAPENIHDQCIEYAKRIKIWDMDCDNIIERLGNALCES